MFKYFDKTFFKFTLGFLAILCLSFAVFIVTGYYQMKEQESTVIKCCAPFIPTTTPTTNARPW